jgi:pyruvate dehydrogenase E1 component alpha subunit
MTEMRRMEIVSDLLYKQKLIRGFCHLYDGQEAVAVGMQHSLTFEDAIIGAYRIHGIALSRGETTHKIIAEMMQKATGSS